MMVKKTKSCVIVIGGSDPSGGAGIQAGLFTLQSLKVPAFSVVTALTAQTEKRFFSYECVSRRNFVDQLESLRSQAPGSIVKIGMLGSGRLIPPLVSWLKMTRPRYVIFDPVLRSSTGSGLLDKEGLRLLKSLLSHVDLLTPNIGEAEFLSKRKIRTREEGEEAGRKILEKVRGSVLIKGGHLKGADAVDLLITKSPHTPFFKGGQSNFSPPGQRGASEDFVMTFRHKRLTGKGAHGTGCTLASAIAGYLVLGKSLPEALRGAKKIVLRKLLNSGRLR